MQKDEKVFLQDAKAAETAAKLNALFSFLGNSSETGTQTAQQLQMNQAMAQGQLSQDARAAGAGAALTTQQNIEADDLALYQF